MLNLSSDMMAEGPGGGFEGGVFPTTIGARTDGGLAFKAIEGGRSGIKLAFEDLAIDGISLFKGTGGRLLSCSGSMG
jgi:hypothetical protein